ncbi:MAG: hypothetical protein Q9218_004430 [Villophora microphyllina]
MSGDPSAPGGSIPRAQPDRNYIQTNNLTSNRTQRFSWQETPLEVQVPTFQQFSSPTNSTIDESPISPLDGHQTFPSIPQAPAAPQYPMEKPPVVRTGSPYNVPGMNQTHPAYFAPVVEDHKPLQPNAPQPSSISRTMPEKLGQKDRSPPPAFAPNATSGQKDSFQAIKPDSDRSTLVYNPHSLAGPNAAVENHRPGQVAHPNAAIEPEWKHGLCEDEREVRDREELIRRHAGPASAAYATTPAMTYAPPPR